MKIVVTGGAGFIGSNLVLELEKQGNEVTVVDNLSSGNMRNIKSFNGRFIEADVSKDFDIEGKFDVVVHLASITDTTFKDNEEMIRQNVDGFRNMIDLTLKNNAKFVYASSAAIYGNGKTPMKEDQKPEPLNTYAQSKVMIDFMAKNHFDRLTVIGLRYFNVFGPGESFKGKSSSMLYQLYKKMKQGNKPRLFKHGEQKRDHIYIMDVINATIKAINAKKSGIYNVGTGTATTFNELIGILSEVLNTDYEIEYFENPYNEAYQNDTQADTKNVERGLGFKAEYDVKKGMAEYAKWIDENEQTCQLG